MAQPGHLYADLAHYYDQFCTDIDYPAQGDFARRAFAVFSEGTGKDYLDLACGTGQHLLNMLNHDFSGSGLDNSAAMLEQTALRCPNAPLYLADMADLDAEQAFDLITCFLYSLHYSHPTSAVEATLASMFRALKPGGVFIFNAVDARGINNDAGVTTRVALDEGELRFQSAWSYTGTGEVLDLHLTITRDTATGTRQWQDQHTMTALTFPQLENMLTACGFSVAVLEHDYERLSPLQAGSFNALFIAGKPL